MCSRKAILAETIKDLRLKTQMFNLSRMPGRFEAMRGEHLAVVSAPRAGDAAAAIAARIENFERGVVRRPCEL